MGLTKVQLQEKYKALKKEVADLKEQLDDSNLKRIVDKVEQEYEGKLDEHNKQLETCMDKKYSLSLENKKLKQDIVTLKANLDKNKTKTANQLATKNKETKMVKSEVLMWRKEFERVRHNLTHLEYNTLQNYNIKMGEHYSKPRTNQLFWRPLSLTYTIVFNNNLGTHYDYRKDIVDGDGENDFNKLFGFNFGILPHKNSIRVGWRPVRDYSNQYELTPYVYIDGIRQSFQSFRVEEGVPIAITIKYNWKEKYWTLSIIAPEKDFVTNIEIPFSNFAYLHSPYVGGQGTLNRNISILSTEPRAYAKSTEWIRGTVGRYSIVAYLLFAFFVPAILSSLGYTLASKVVAILGAFPVIFYPIYNVLREGKAGEWLDRKLTKVKSWFKRK